MKKYMSLALLTLSLASCRVAKKDWVKEQFTEQATTQSIKRSQDSVFKKEISRIETTVSRLETTVSNQETSSQSSSENESTTVTGTITAEPGKEKSVTVGGTTIKSNGANVTFETNSSKSVNKEYETRFAELTIEAHEKEVTINELQTELTSLKSEFANFVSTYQSEKTIKSKSVKTTGFSFGFWLTIIIVTIVIIIIFYFRKSIPFFK